MSKLSLHLLFFLLFAFVKVNAQEIRKGLMEIDFNMGANYTKHTYLNATGLSITPKYGRFITDHWLLGSGARFGAVSINNGFEYEAKFVSVGISPYAQYFFNPKAKWAVFLKAECNVFTSFGAETPFNNKSQSSILGYRASVGVNRFLSKTLVFQSSLGLENQLLLSSYNNNFTYIPGLVWSFNIKNLLSFEKVEIPKGEYLKHGRQIIGLDMEYTYNLRKEFGDCHVNLEAEYGYFLKNNLLVGAKLSDSDKFNIGEVYSRYFLPLHKKTFANIQAGVGFGHYRDETKLSYNFSARLSHFIASDVMLDIELISYRHKGKISEFTAGPTIGLKRFLK